MDKSEFLHKLFSMFPMNFTEDNVNYWLEAYEAVLTVPLDFNKLFLIMVSNYDKTNTAPSPKWFKENMSGAIKKNDKCPALVHIESIRQEEREPMPEELKKKFEQLKKKLSMW